MKYSTEYHRMNNQPGKTVNHPRLYKSKWFQRFARKEGIEDADLLDAADRAEKGFVDADPGGGVLKQRIARQGKGKSGGFRTILFYRAGERAVFRYGFAKNDRGNIDDDEVRAFKAASGHVLALSAKQMAELAKKGDSVEVMRDEQKTVSK